MAELLVLVAQMCFLVGGRMADGVMQIHRPGAGHHVHHGDRWVPILFFAEKDADPIS